MMVTSLSFTYLQVSATAGATATRPAASGAPSPAPQAVAQDDCRCHDDKPRRSPFVRALKEALQELATSLRAGGASAADKPADTAAAVVSTEAAAETAATAEPADLEEALMDFARALMQALREQGGQRRERVDGDHGERHHRHHHHRHGHASWGDPAQRVDALAQQIQASAPAVSAGSTAGVAAVAGGDATPATTGPVVATAVTAEAGADKAATPSQGTTVYVTPVNVTANAEAAASASPFAGLLEAFAKLQKTLGKADDDDGALPKALSEFLQTLAAKLRGEDLPTAEAATEPGALIDVAA